MSSFQNPLPPTDLPSPNQASQASGAASEKRRPPPVPPKKPHLSNTVAAVAAQSSATGAATTRQLPPHLTQYADTLNRLSGRSAADPQPPASGTANVLAPAPRRNLNLEEEAINSSTDFESMVKNMMATVQARMAADMQAMTERLAALDAPAAPPPAPRLPTPPALMQMITSTACEAAMQYALKGSTARCDQAAAWKLFQPIVAAALGRAVQSGATCKGLTEARFAPATVAEAIEQYSTGPGISAVDTELLAVLLVWTGHRQATPVTPQDPVHREIMDAQPIELAYFQPMLLLGVELAFRRLSRYPAVRATTNAAELPLIAAAAVRDDPAMAPYQGQLQALARILPAVKPEAMQPPPGTAPLRLAPADARSVAVDTSAWPDFRDPEWGMSYRRPPEFDLNSNTIRGTLSADSAPDITLEFAFSPGFVSQYMERAREGWRDSEAGVSYVPAGRVEKHGNARVSVTLYPLRTASGVGYTAIVTSPAHSHGLAVTGHDRAANALDLKERILGIAESVAFEARQPRDSSRFVAGELSVTEGFEAFPGHNMYRTETLHLNRDGSFYTNSQSLAAMPLMSSGQARDAFGGPLLGSVTTTRQGTYGTWHAEGTDGRGYIISEYANGACKISEYGLRYRDSDPQNASSVRYEGRIWSRQR